MYQKKVSVKNSEIDGRGVFAEEKINKGDIVWKFDEKHDKTLSINQFESLSDLDKKSLNRIAYLSKESGSYVYPPKNDPANYTNHSENNNLDVLVNKKISTEPIFVANRDIKKGEEITNNYNDFDDSTSKIDFTS